VGQIKPYGSFIYYFQTEDTLWRLGPRSKVIVKAREEKYVYDSAGNDLEEIFVVPTQEKR